MSANRSHGCGALAAALVALALLPAPATASAVSGPSLRIGLAFHDSEATAYRFANDYDSAGLVVGADYQFAVDRQFSLNPFFSLSFEGTEDLRQDPEIAHSLLGLEGRFWVHELYLGAHFGVLRQSVDGDTYEADGAGVEYGLVFGMENEGGTYVEGRLVRGRGLDVWSDTDVDVTGLRLNLGYRFH